MVCKFEIQTKSRHSPRDTCKPDLSKEHIAFTFLRPKLLLLIGLLKAPIQIPSNLLGDSRVHARKLSNLQQLEQFAKDKLANIPQDRCLQLVANYPTRLLVVIQQKGYTINYWIGGY